MGEISDSDILATALLTIKQHGESAASYAASRTQPIGFAIISRWEHP